MAGRRMRRTDQPAAATPARNNTITQSETEPRAGQPRVGESCNHDAAAVPMANAAKYCATKMYTRPGTRFHVSRPEGLLMTDASALDYLRPCPRTRSNE